MSRFIRYLATLPLLCLAQHAVAADLCPGPLGRDLQATRCAIIPFCCPDDYCRKPSPCIPCFIRPSCVNDYRPKPMPCIPCPCTPGCADDYCRKPLPRFGWPVMDHLTCCPSCNSQPAAPSPPGAKPVSSTTEAKR